MKTLVIAEHDNQQLNAVTQNAVTAAAGLQGEVDILVAGENVAAVAEQAAGVSGVGTVLVADAEQYAAQLAEELAPLVVEQVQSGGYQALVAPSSTFGKNLTPRVAALLDVAQVSDVIEVKGVGSYVRPIYAGNVMLTVESAEPVQVLTVRPTAFDAAEQTGSAEIRSVEATAAVGVSTLVGRELSKSDRPELGSAEVVVSGGRGLGDGDKYREVLEPLADRLGAALGASRAAVDAGFVPNDYQVGQTGKIVAPQLYLAVGISGAIQHLAGMSDSKVIVAINKDPDAPIFQVADYGLEGDLFELVPELTQQLA
ncbi:electron transfer flavoprotein subunit alpha/FixB family protein [Marinobacterium sp. AK62]|uniref:Electron transfer flavoprotein subunit alpha/FixB family protein n=1 Tax=Marinobacterium alkalitolerans TaxID=1542925 RepID=A0ABS3Z6W4_9GAMM|nr:FAD-binding protein [Marinobacterium alkalitolerans]MBP0047457.1 electron transfer flavoprotein subunit alpha/FixB family protein [Marinobacterium alkalitolerans]